MYAGLVLGVPKSIFRLIGCGTEEPAHFRGLVGCSFCLACARAEYCGSCAGYSVACSVVQLQRTFPSLHVQRIARSLARPRRARAAEGVEGGLDCWIVPAQFSLVNLRQKIMNQQLQLRPANRANLRSCCRLMYHVPSWYYQAPRNQGDGCS